MTMQHKDTLKSAKGIFRPIKMLGRRPKKPQKATGSRWVYLCGHSKHGVFPAPGQRVQAQDGRIYEMQPAGNLILIKGRG